MIPFQAIRPLPARAAPLSGESLASLVRRTAEAMGYEGPPRVRSLLSDCETAPVNVNLLPPGPLLDQLAGMLHRRTADVAGMTFHCFAAQLVLAARGAPCPSVADSKTILKYFVTSASPVCPTCLKEDAVPHERLAWSFRALPMCMTHRCLLVSQCPDCHRALRCDRQSVSCCPCGYLLSESRVDLVSPRGIDLARMLEQLLMNRACLLPEMSPAATFWWADRLAAAAAKTPTWMEGVARRMGFDGNRASSLLAWLSAAEILAGWPDRFEEFLGVFQQVVKHRTTSTGISRRFGLLLREAGHLERIGYPAPANALRDYLLRHYAAGHLSRKVCLFQGPENAPLLAGRPWLSQTAAARLLEIRSGAIAPLVARGALMGQIHPAGQHGRSIGLVSRQSVESLQRELRSALDVGVTARRLGIGRHAVLDLIRADVLPRAIRTARGWQVPLQSVAAWEAFCTELPRLKGESTDWISLRQATRVAGPSGLKLRQLLQLIQAGSLKARLADPRKCLNGIAVSRSDLAAAQREARHQGNPSSDWSLQCAAQNLFPARPVKPYVLKRWIREGLLRGYEKNRRTVIPAAEIQRFRAEYCLAQEAMQILGLSRSTLSRWEVQGRITPVYGKRVASRAGFSLYRREDLR
jgi:hypothetical protein